MHESRFLQPRVLAITAAVCSMFFLVLAAAVRADIPDAVDLAVTNWVAGQRSPLLTSFFAFATDAGNVRTVVVVIAASTLLLWLRGQTGIAVSMVLATWMAFLLEHSFKALISRVRPDINPIGIEPSFAFPSGHATLSATTFLFLAAAVYAMMPPSQLRNVILALVLLVPLIVGASRVYLGLHWFSDVMGGWLLGTACVAAAYAVALRRV